MIPSILLGSAVIPDTTTEMRLYQSGELFSIKIPGRGELMNSRVHGSEQALAELTCERLGANAHPRLLVGGLGMGFTLAAALSRLGPGAEVVVAELVPEVVEWNRTFMGAAAGHPLDDARSSVYIGDVGDLIRQQPGGFDAILLDVDNGPEALVRRENDWLYSAAGLQAARDALRAHGVLAVWSATPDRPFSRRLQQAGFTVEEVVVRPHRARKGSRHHIWLAAVADARAAGSSR
ncbi:MAG: spermidine synthase [Pseudomonadales bacterium]